MNEVNKMMKIKNDECSTSLSNNNCKNTRENNGMKSVKCICGSTRLSASISSNGEGAGDWLLLSCKRCGNTLYYNGA